MAHVMKTVAIVVVAGGLGCVAGAAGKDELEKRIGVMIRAAKIGVEARSVEQGEAVVTGDASSEVPTSVSATWTDERSGTEPARSGGPPKEVWIAQATSRAMLGKAIRPIVEPPMTVSDRAGAAGSGDRQRRLAQAIQSELQRVGCYSGSIDGEWGAETRRAMKAFNDRVNATLPITQPDYILLTLLQGHAAKACGATCPPGQAEAENGSCQPRSVLAEARRQSAVPSPPASVASQPVAPAQAERARRDAAPRTPRKDVSELAITAAERARLIAEEAKADGEQQRIAAAEQRKRRRAAEAEAKAVADRLSRLAEADRARERAEQRRREELAALVARQAVTSPTTRASAHATGIEPRVASALSVTTSPADAPHTRTDQPVPSAAPLRQDTGQGAAHAPASSSPASPVSPAQWANEEASARRKPKEAKFVGRFMPPPTYRVGRLPASQPQRTRREVVFVNAPRGPTRRGPGPQELFREMQRRSP